MSFEMGSNDQITLIIDAVPDAEPKKNVTLNHKTRLRVRGRWGYIFRVAYFPYRR